MGRLEVISGKIKMKSKFRESIFNFKNRSHLSVGFSDSRLRIFQLEKERKSFEVLGFSERKIPKGVINQGEIVKSDDFIQIFREALENVDGEFSVKEVMLTIPEEKIFTRVIEIPFSENKDELENGIKWETEANIPLPLEEIYYDWKKIEEKDSKVDVLVMAVDRKTIEDYLKIFDELGLKIVSVEPESLSMARSLIEENTKEYSLLIDIGSNSSNFAICRGKTPIFTANSSISGRSMTEMVVKNLGISFEKGESYKIKRGLEKNLKFKKSGEEIFGSILQDLVSEIEKTIEFLKENLFLEEKNKKIEKIILCGGGSNLKGLDSYLTVHLKQTVIQSNPWINLNFKKNVPPISKQNSQGFASVIGLSLKNLKKEKKSVNLLSDERKSELMFDDLNSFLIKQGAVFFLGILVLILFLAANIFIINIYEKMVTNQMKQTEVGNLNRIIEQAKNRAGSSFDETEIFVKNIKNTTTYWEYLNEINKVLPEQVYYSKILIDKESLKLEGLAKDRESLVVFRDRLKQLEVFSKVEMPISNFTSEENINFVIDLSLN